TASNPVRGKRLPRMQHSGELLAALQLEDDMHMIRHHAPRVENVPTPIEVLQSSGDDAAVFAQQPRAMRRVKLSIDASRKGEPDSRTINARTRSRKQAIALGVKRKRDLTRHRVV
ncbi:MAG TPA: hypothetical protein VJ032_04995, partial [Thermoanaerobaculia bacterium]|nr:hypothetical protein [Thermoanaerobaculia bacterium]